MNAQFETEKEAQAALEAARKKNLGWCPLIKLTCMKSCICYYEGTMRQGSSPGHFWFTYYPCCTNVLISGVITVKQ